MAAANAVANAAAKIPVRFVIVSSLHHVPDAVPSFNQLNGPGFITRRLIVRM
jgi:hypothetical protein